MLEEEEEDEDSVESAEMMNLGTLGTAVYSKMGGRTLLSNVPEMFPAGK